MQKYILCLLLIFFSTNASAQVENLPNNPWGTPEQTPSYTDTAAKEVVKTENSVTDLPQNPWSSVQKDNQQPMGQKVNYHQADRQTATVTPFINSAGQQPYVRQVGGVGKIGYTYTSRADSEKNNDDSSLFDGLMEKTSTQTIPEAPTTENIVPDTDFDFSYEKIKQKSVNQWHRLTSPITNTAQRWFNAVKQTGEDLLK